MSIMSHPTLVSMVGEVKNLDMVCGSNWKRLFAFIKIDWSRANAKVKHAGRILKLPETAYLPVYKHRAVKRIMSGDYTARLVLTHDGFSYIASSTLLRKLMQE